jgi:hypothetical protein
MGQISKVQCLAQKSQEPCRDSSIRLAEELSKSELKDEERKLMKAAETAFREVKNAYEKDINHSNLLRQLELSKRCIKPLLKGLRMRECSRPKLTLES